MFGWNIVSRIISLPLTQEFIHACEQEFSMQVRDINYPFSLYKVNWQNLTMEHFDKEIDKQYLTQLLCWRKWNKHQVLLVK